jgi:hypothetical protein
MENGWLVVDAIALLSYGIQNLGFVIELYRDMKIGFYKYALVQTANFS